MAIPSETAFCQFGRAAALALFIDNPVVCFDMVMPPARINLAARIDLAARINAKVLLPLVKNKRQFRGLPGARPSRKTT